MLPNFIYCSYLWHSLLISFIVCGVQKRLINAAKVFLKEEVGSPCENLLVKICDLEPKIFAPSKVSTPPRPLCCRHRVRPPTMVEPLNLMPFRNTYLSLDNKYPRDDTKLHSFVEHTPRENSKIYIFPLGS